jgi:hypothetical protein
MKAGELAVDQEDNWRKFSITLIDPGSEVLRVSTHPTPAANRYNPAYRTSPNELR